MNLNESMSVGRAAAVRRLPEALIDQIAAGEVVERPASVVKELVENALDAGALRIRVDVRGGGRDWIAVSDDGRGMSADDARLALSRHATSKIASADDLHRIATYGFRGEALPAIASVSRLRLRTRPRGAPAAVELRVEDGRWVEERVVGGPEGTRVEVADLFASVPARRKFLKTVTTEWGHVADWLARSALARPDVHFDVCRDDRPALAWPAARDPLDRIAAVMSEDDAAAFVRVEGEEGGAALRGFVSRPDRHRGTLGGVYWFVNRRPVRDRLLQHALVEIYRDLLPRGRFPVAVLFLDLPPSAVDVNVHPAKWEVRFGDPSAIHRLVRHAVRAAVAERRWVVPGPDRPPGPGGRRGAPVTPPTDDWIFARRSDGERPPEGQPPAPEPPAGEGARTGLPVRFGGLRLLGQLLSSYLVLETRDGLLLMDQHAAHERVLYERLRAEWLERRVASQGLLVPEPVSLDPVRLAALLGCGDAATRLGFELDAFGEDAVAVRAVPALLAGRDPASLVGHLADEIAAAGLDTGTPRTGPRALEAADRVFASLACHGSRRQGERLDEREQRSLLEAVDAIPWAPTCPHGRPVFVPFGRDEIERRFGRR